MLNAVRVGSNCKDSLQPIPSLCVGRIVNQWEQVGSQDAAASLWLETVNYFAAVTDVRYL